MREVYAASCGECLVAGITGRHDGREKSLGAVGSAGAAIVIPVRVNLFHRLVVQQDGRGGVRMAQIAIASDVLHHITMKFMYHRHVYNQVLLPSKLDVFDEEVGATFAITGRDIFDLRRISGALTYRLQRFQHEPMSISSVATVLLACVNMIPEVVYDVLATRARLPSYCTKAGSVSPRIQQIQEAQSALSNDV